MIRAESIDVTYPNGVRALTGGTLSIDKGSFTVLLGPSGAGKSTLLRTLNGLVTPNSGRLVVEGIGEIESRSSLQLHRQRTGMIFQQHHLIGRASVLTNVLTGRLSYRKSLVTLFGFPRAEKERALAAIDRVGLLNEALRRVDELSGGQQQRVGVARALVQSPNLVLADEPVASLDPATAERVLAMLHEICHRDGLTAVVSLHQVELAKTFADRIVGLAAGRIVFDGSPNALDDQAVQSIYGNIRPVGDRLGARTNPKIATIRGAAS